MLRLRQVERRSAEASSFCAHGLPSDEFRRYDEIARLRIVLLLGIMVGYLLGSLHRGPSSPEEGGVSLAASSVRHVGGLSKRARCQPLTRRLQGGPLVRQNTCICRSPSAFNLAQSFFQTVRDISPGTIAATPRPAIVHSGLPGRTTSAFTSRLRRRGHGRSIEGARTSVAHFWYRPSNPNGSSNPQGQQ